MARFDVVGTFLDAPVEYLSGISDMELVPVAGGWRLYTAGPPGGGLLAFDLDGGAAAGVALIDRLSLAEGPGLHAPVRLDRVTLDGGAGLLLSGAHAGQLTGIDLAAGGGLDSPMRLAGGASGVISAQAVVRLGAEIYVFAAALFDPAITCWRLDADGRAAWVSETALPREMQGIDVVAMQSWAAGGQTFLSVLSAGTDALRSYRVETGGRLVEVSTLGAGAGLGIAAPSAMTIVEMAGRDYALVAAAGTSSVSVVRLEPGGRMTLADHVADSRDTRFQGVGAVVSVTIDGRVFVIVGGGDDGISLMTLLPGGRLLHLANQTREAGLPLDNVTALAARVTGGVIDLFAAGEGTGLMRMRIDPGPVGVEALGGSGDDTLSGGAAGDLLSGAAGDDSLHGAAGRDILIDGAGADRLYGGDGVDWFVLSGDGAADMILDYEPGVDRIDLSAWGRVHDLSALSIRYRSNGTVTVTYAAETLTLVPAAGLAIPRDGFRATEFFTLWHVSGDPMIEGLRLEGSAADDRMIAGGGEDTLAGSPGADRMDGGAGFDAVEYADAGGATHADLDGVGPGAGWGMGDVFFNIEALFGGTGDDRLAGSAGANLLRGAAGSDRLAARAGDDTLLGGTGDDTLEGGAGADRLTGGAGIDAAGYAGAGAWLTADLGAAFRNTGVAAGDVYEGIEALIGSAHDDALAGDGLGNGLSGGDGDDRLEGRRGDDALWGGAGQDTLDGGAGDDSLWGGAGFDLVVLVGGEPLRVDLSVAGPQDTGQGFDWFDGIEGLEGGEAGDGLTGDASGNGLAGAAGDDALRGAAGSGTLWGGAGDDALSGGDGGDWVVYAAGAAIRLTLAGGQASGEGRDALDGIENARTGAGHDRLEGSAPANVLWAGPGDDGLAGLSGDDRLDGGAGDDTLTGGRGADRIAGGDGHDLAVFDGAGPIRVDLRLAGAQDTGAGRDRLTGIEDLRAGSGPDRLTGDAGANRLDGRGGADTLAGLSGRDMLLGEGGADRLSGGGWADRLWGGDGRDALDGGAGDDALWGGAGADRLEGGAGDDRLTGGSGADRFVFTGGRDVAVDVHRRQGDRLVLERDDLGIPRGMSEAAILQRYGVDRAHDVWLEFGPHDRIVLEGLADLLALGDVLTVI